MARHVDDPTTINAFLRLIHGTPLSASPNARAEPQTVPLATLNPTSHESGDGIASPESWVSPDGASVSAETSPARGSRAPPPTPETQPVSNGISTPLEPIFEDASDWSSGTKQTPVNMNNPECCEGDSSPPNHGSLVKDDLIPMTEDLTSTQNALLVKRQPHTAGEDQDEIRRKLRERAACYMEETVEKFRQSKAAMFVEAERQAVQETSRVAEVNTTRIQDTRMTGTVQTSKLAKTPEMPVSMTGLHSLADDSSIHRMQNPATKNEAMPTAQENEIVKERIHNSDESPFSASTNGGIACKDTPSTTTLVAVDANTKENIRQDNQEEDGSESSDEGTEQDREHLTHFKTWGKPTGRDQPSARVRKVTLSGLPLNADLTLVQSLIHGGAVEYMALAPASPESRALTAHVIFVSADACDKFYDKYPNGIELRHQSKHYAVMVEKGKNVDVISGMMQGYLECGATRVLKVSPVDDDWGIVALHRLAEGKQKIRHVEAIVDVYRNDNRTVMFRFGNITHAVQFKGVLIRSHDFDGCSVTFAEDPCEAAASFHDD